MSSSSVTSRVARERGVAGERGVPSKCLCGSEVTIFVSKTQENQGRPFFRCVRNRDVNTWTTKRDGHLFKWVEDPVFEEVEDALPRLAIVANEISKVKAETNEMLNQIQELKEEAIARKKELVKCKEWLYVCFLLLCVITIVVAYVMFGQGNQKKLSIGY
uniref:Uncharacterized protein At2g07090 n=1 Tax=Arabidopsis thaliana TaxID=3702 RepID=Q9ZV82_ARATH|nr:hypothetical protein [Arabidopsis thaliana]